MEEEDEYFSSLSYTMFQNLKESEINEVMR